MTGLGIILAIIATGLLVAAEIEESAPSRVLSAIFAGAAIACGIIGALP